MRRIPDAGDFGPEGIELGLGLGPVGVREGVIGSLDGEFAHPFAKSDDPNDGYVMRVHPFFATEPAVVPALVLYQLVLVNYGDFASPEDAETFGAAVLGIDREAYYDQLCELADMVSTGIATMYPAAAAHGHAGCGGGGCSCG